jgi:hypothetical protein
MTPIQLKESNKKITKYFLESRHARNVESVKRQFGIDVSKLAESMENKPDYSIRKLHESVYRKVGEANSASAMGQVLRAGINNIANNWYEMADTVHDQYVQKTVSNKSIEPYAPMYRAGIPVRTGKGQPFKAIGKFTGHDILIENEKFGGLIDVERELIDDDQTGQVVQRARDGGENMALVENDNCAHRFISIASDTNYPAYGTDSIPADPNIVDVTGVAGATSVWNTALLGGGANRPTSFSTNVQDTLQAAWIQLMLQKDGNGIKLSVTPNTVIAGANYKFAIDTLLNSQTYAAVNAIKLGAGGTATDVGALFAKNVMAGLVTPVYDKFLPAGAYAMGMAGKGMVMQVRDPLEILQENPASGSSFECDVWRFRTRARWEVGWIDSRFWYLCASGTASLT